jgi:hypothetical protein
MPPLRKLVGMLSLFAALAGLVAIWWTSIGARAWNARRRKEPARQMIDVPLALVRGSDNAQPDASEVA